MKKFLLGILLGILLTASNTRAEEPEISVKAEIDKAFITLGERVEYRVTITRDPSVQVLTPVPPPPSDLFELKEVHDLSEKQGKLLVEGRRFVLTAYELGEFILDPVRIEYRAGKGEPKTIETNRLYLTVQSVDPSGQEKTDIRGPKGVLELPRQWGLALGTLLALGAIGGGVWFWVRWKRRALAGGILSEPPLSPEEEALVRLNRLFDSDLIRRGKQKEYFLELSEILKHYFERRFEIPALEATTSEILRDLKLKVISGSLREKIEQVLGTADLVKFAKYKPAPSEIPRINQTAKALVEEARPKIPEPSVLAASSPHGV